MNNKNSYFWTCLIILILFVVFSLFFSINLGTVKIPYKEVKNVILYHLKESSFLFSGLNAKKPEGKIDDVVWLIRFPRLVLAIMVGTSLSICGAVMQATVQNTLAEPYVLGISSGASLGATLAIMLGFGNTLGGNFIGIMAFLGAFIISLMVILLSNVGGRSDAVKLLLSGLALGALCNAFASFVIYFSPNREGMRDIAYWMMGSLAGANWKINKVLFLITVFGVIFFLTQSRRLNIMLLGDDTAITLGMNPSWLRQLYLLISSLMTGFIVYAAGTIGFVGLIIPHQVRMVFGSDHKKLIPISALLGAVFLLWADVLCRVILPGRELPIGILTSMIGAPCFIYLMAKKKYGFGGSH